MPSMVDWVLLVLEARRDESTSKVGGKEQVVLGLGQSRLVEGLWWFFKMWKIHAAIAWPSDNKQSRTRVAAMLVFLFPFSFSFTHIPLRIIPIPQFLFLTSCVLYGLVCNDDGDDDLTKFLEVYDM